MPSDAVTFFAAFAAVFAGLAAFVWHMEIRAHALEQRLAALEDEAGMKGTETDSGREIG